MCSGAHGFTVTNTFSAADPALGKALSSGIIDMYWQYTGTELTDTGYLNLSAGQFPTDLPGAFAKVKQLDEARQLCWVAPTQFDDTNGIAIKASDAAKYGTSLSAFGAYLTSHPKTTVCIQSEFLTRPDGLPGLVTTYGWPSAASFHYTQIGSTAEKAIASGQCAAGEVYTTDSGIEANNEQTLTDDKNLFPPDNAGLVVRSDVLQKHPIDRRLDDPGCGQADHDGDAQPQRHGRDSEPDGRQRRARVARAERVPFELMLG